jgi:isocitrate dehydrogenase
MTKDLALLVGSNQSWMETIEFLGLIEKNLKKALAK